MKKILYTIIIAGTLLICGRQKAAAGTVTINMAGDTIWNTWNNCSVPDTLGLYIYGYTSGYLVTDSVTIQVSFGDGTDTTFMTSIAQNYFWGYMPHTYTLPGVYSTQFIVTGPDGAADTLVNNNSIIVASQCGNISGKVYYDANSDCIYNAGDLPMKWVYVRLLYNGTLVGGAYTDSSGNYTFNAPLGFTFTMEVDYTYSANLSTTCPASGIYTISSLPATNIDFGTECSQSGFDLMGHLYAWGLRPALNAWIYFDYWNSACTPVSGTVTVTLPAGVTYVSSNPPASNVNGQVVTYNANPYKFYWNYQWWSNSYIEVLGDAGLVIGDTLCFDMQLDPQTGDLNPADNFLETCVPVRNSCDPNEKFESHAKWSSANIAPATKLDYTVGFQNVGNDVAINVSVIDTLDSDADINTLQITAASHPMNIYMIGTNILKFEFANINLAAANVSEPLSHGFVSYKIKPKTGLANGTMLDNKASIIFDFNSAIVTNKVTDIIDVTLGVSTIDAPIVVNAFPNPATDYIRIKLPDESDAIVQLIDLSGRIALVQTVKNNGLVKVNNLSSGVYSLQITSGEKNYSGKVIVK